MPARAFNWTDTRVALAKAMWGRGESGDTIATELNKNLTLADTAPVTRNAVIGKMHRAGMGPIGGKNPHRPVPSTHPVVPKRVAPSALPRPSSPPPGLGEALAFARAQGCTLLDLRNGSCRWPIGMPGTPNFHFCGGKAPGIDAKEPYCGYHSRMAYAAPVARRDQRPRPR